MVCGGGEWQFGEIRGQCGSLETLEGTVAWRRLLAAFGLLLTETGIALKEPTDPKQLGEVKGLHPLSPL